MNEQALLELARRTPTAEREALLDRESAGNPALRARIEALLQADAAAALPSSPHDATSGYQATASYTSSEPTPGFVIAGRYVLEMKLGEGGMGEVWAGKQTEPVKRKVALKLIKAGMDSKSVVQRFEQERQALAMMDHPNIAKVLDGGITTDRRPYFVMELVNGLPLTKFCDDAKLGIQERLELFVPICQAVQHAHQKGIVHRDLKPGNILVTTIDGKAVPKVIDFGVAKATSGRLTEETLSTQFGAVVGTLEYMAPEQAGFTGEDIDTRADIYSLGIILYELLTGLRPFDKKRLKKAALDEMIRVIREEEPSKPSTRLSTDESLASVAAIRHIEPHKLTALLRGELDWVVMKCLEKQRDRRYETANGLARDIQRYLADEVVEARPPSTGYRLMKFVRRHKGQVTAAAIILLTLVGGVLGTTWGLYTARQQRDRANQEAARATAFNSFLEQMFLAVNPEVKGSREVTVLELVNKASEKADVTLTGQPQVEAAVRSFLGTTLNGLGKPLEARKQLEKALALHQNGVDTNTFAHSETLRGLGIAASEIGDFKSAASYHRQAFDIVHALGEQRLEEQASQQRMIAHALIHSSQYPEAEQHIQQCEVILKRLPNISPSIRSDLAFLKARLAQDWKGDLELTEKYSTEALQFQRDQGIETRLADSLNSLAVIKMKRGKFDEAIPLYEEAIALHRRSRGDAHANLAIAMENLANTWFRKKEYAKASALLEQVAAMRDKVLGPGSFPAARTRFNMAMILTNQNKEQQAIEIFDQILPVFRQNVGEKSTEVATLLRNRGICRKDLKSYDAALKDFLAALEIANAINKPTGDLRLKVLFDLTQIYRLQGNKQRADEMMKLALSVLEAGNPDHDKWIKKYAELPASGIYEQR